VVVDIRAPFAAELRALLHCAVEPREGKLKELLHTSTVQPTIRTSSRRAVVRYRCMLVSTRSWRKRSLVSVSLRPARSAFEHFVEDSDFRGRLAVNEQGGSTPGEPSTCSTINVRIVRLDQP
jgi:hypothetical protein